MSLRERLVTCVEFSKPSHKLSSSPRAGRVGSLYGAVVGWSAARPVPARLRSLAYRAFARAVGANLDEVELDLDEYGSLGDFFVRRLREGARTVDRAIDAITSPCDGVIAARGVATAGTLVQAKGRDYRLEELVASPELAAKLEGGAYMTIYLSPRDYHRVHTPVDARVESYDYLPGYLFPVNPLVAARRDSLLAKNERVVIELNAGRLGTVGVVMVAAVGVGNIELVRGLDSTSLRAAGQRKKLALQDLRVSRGDELGAFRLGSTVVLLFEPGKAELAGEVGQALRFGERIGTATT